LSYNAIFAALGHYFYDLLITNNVTEPATAGEIKIAPEDAPVVTPQEHPLRPVVLPVVALAQTETIPGIFEVYVSPAVSTVANLIIWSFILPILSCKTVLAVNAIDYSSV